MATVLLSALAATIAVVIVRQTVIITQNESSRTDTSRLGVTASEVQLAFERQLAINPEFYLTQTFQYERPRLCTATLPVEIADKYLVPTRDGGGELVSQPWPDGCGTTWDYPNLMLGGATITSTNGFTATGTPSAYTTTAQGWDPADFTTRAEVIPPSAGSPYLTLKVLASGGRSETGITATYLRQSASEWTLWSSSDLVMSEIAGGQSLGPDAFVYSGGKVVLPTVDSTMTASMIAGEEGIVGSALDSGTRLLSGDADQVASEEYLDIRTAVDRPLSIAELRESSGATADAACPGGAVSNNLVGAVTYASAVCLEDGASIIDTSGVTTAVPAGVQAWLVTLLPDLGSGPRLGVYYSLEEPLYVENCLGPCDLEAVEQALGGTDRDPAAAPGTDPWSLLGVSYYPQTGVVKTGADLFAGTPTASGNLAESLTLLAGDQSSPKDLFINGSLSAEPGAHLGMIGTARAVFGYFGADASGDVSVTGSIAALGIGVDGPATVGAPERTGGVAGEGMDVSITGSLVTDGIGPIGSANTFEILPDPELRTSGAPLFVSFGSNWERSTSVDKGSSFFCSGGLDADHTTCLGIW